jgi:predicted nuclease of predicted toxin-antitoxin system
VARFLIDEDLPRPLAAALRALGEDAVHVREAGHGGATDDAVSSLAKLENRVLVTADLDFSDVRRFPLGEHSGVVVARLPNEWTVDVLVAAVVAALKALTEEEIRGALVIVEPHRIRIRR